MIRRFLGLGLVLVLTSVSISVLSQTNNPTPKATTTVFGNIIPGTGCSITTPGVLDCLGPTSTPTFTGLLLSGGALTVNPAYAGATTFSPAITINAPSPLQGVHQFGYSGTADSGQLQLRTDLPSSNVANILNAAHAGWSTLCYRGTDPLYTDLTTVSEHMCIGWGNDLQYNFIESSGGTLITNNPLLPPSELRIQQTGGVDPTGGIFRTCAITLNSTTITCTVAGGANGSLITGTGIPPATTVASGGGTVNIVASANSTATNGTASLNFQVPTFAQRDAVIFTRQGLINFKKLDGTSNLLSLDRTSNINTISSSGTLQAISGNLLRAWSADNSSGIFSIGTTNAALADLTSFGGSGATMRFLVADTGGSNRVVAQGINGTLFQFGGSATPVHLSSIQTTAPALTSCGGGSPAIVGTDTAGTVTMGTTATGCVITFNVAYAAAPHCVVTWRATPLLSQSYTVSTAAITLTQTSTSGDLIDYVCIGVAGG